MSRIHIGAVTALVLASGLFMPQAFSHITLETREARLETNYKAVLRVSHGCDGSATTTLRVTVPEGVVGVRPQPKAGWKLATAKGDYAQTYQRFGKDVSSGVKEIVWSGGTLPDEHYDEFVFLAYLSSGLEPGATLHFPTVQECEKGIERWTGTSDAHHHHGGHDHAEQPAPALKLLPKQ